MKKILLAVPYNHLLDITGLDINLFVGLPLYKQEYRDGYKFQETTEECVSVVIPRKEDFITTEIAEININTIMEENNRLTRELELLKEQLKRDGKSDSTTLTTV